MTSGHDTGLFCFVGDDLTSKANARLKLVNDFFLTDAADMLARLNRHFQLSPSLNPILIMVKR